MKNFNENEAFIDFFLRTIKAESEKYSVDLKWFHSLEAVYCICKDPTINRILDVGSGHGFHSHIFRQFGKDVLSLDFEENQRMGGVPIVENPNFIACDFLEFDASNYEFDLIWASHVLEHQPNVSLFLKKLLQVSQEGNVCVTVPRYKHKIVGGHLTIWNMGLLLYNFVFNGFDLRTASWGTYGYNHSIWSRAARNKAIPFGFDNGDVDMCREFVPIEIYEGFDGRLNDHNWISSDERNKLAAIYFSFETMDEFLLRENARLRTEANELSNLLSKKSNPQ